MKPNISDTETLEQLDNIGDSLKRLRDELIAEQNQFIAQSLAPEPSKKKKFSIFNFLFRHRQTDND